jgi:riboflavin kinase/FMN adenylyltransferase
VIHVDSTSFPDAPQGPHVVSIGTFDGVHLGHRYLLRQAVGRATELGLPMLVVTFEPNPAQVIRPDSFRGRLSTPEDKRARLVAISGGDVLVVPFTEDLMRETPESFLGALVEAVQPVEIWVGEAFALGHKRSGDVARLTEIGRDLGFALHAVPRREIGGEIVSSSRIRQHILAGAADEARRLLGYPYRLSGEVIHGAQVGRTIGFPTGNVEPPALLAALPDGIYATLATFDGGPSQHQAMTYIGTRPALNTGARQIETHILDFDGDLYGRTLHTDFIQRLRPDANFDSVDALVDQLKRDEHHSRAVLAALAADPDHMRHVAGEH